MATKKKKSAKKKAARKKLAAKRRTVPKDQLRQEDWIKRIVITILSLIVLVIVGSLMMFAYAWWYGNRQVPSAETVQAVADVEPESLPEPEDQVQRFLNKENPEDLARIKELEVFYWDVLSEPLDKFVVKGEFYVPEVNIRFAELNRRIYTRFRKPAEFVPLPNYAKGAEGNVRAHAAVKDGTPGCVLFLGLLKDIYDRLKGMGIDEWQQTFFNSLITTVEHEFEHLAHSRYPNFDSDSSPLTLDEKLKGEAEIWHNTCLYAIDPMAKDEQPLPSYLVDIHKAWVAGGKQPASLSWLAFIKERKILH